MDFGSFIECVIHIQPPAIEEIGITEGGVFGAKMKRAQKELRGNFSLRRSLLSGWVFSGLG